MGEVVVAATLAVAAGFQPARRRIEALVDRRFNRRRYDAARTIQGFSGRLREQVDLDTLTAELLTVADRTVEPTMVSLWLRPQAEQHTPAADAYASTSSTGSSSGAGRDGTVAMSTIHGSARLSPELVERQGGGALDLHELTLIAKVANAQQRRRRAHHRRRLRVE
jgi:hypothetical protein